MRMTRRQADASFSPQTQERLAHTANELAGEFTGVFARETIERYVEGRRSPRWKAK